MDVGLPAGFQMALTAFSNIFVQSYVNAFGAAYTAGWGIYIRMDMFVIMPMQSIALAITTFTGQNAGAGNPDRIHKGIRVAMTMAFVATTCLVIPEFSWPRISCGCSTRSRKWWQKAYCSSAVCAFLTSSPA